MVKVFTYGVFDLFHLGHLKSLEEAKYLGNHLTVGVFTDRVAESFKRKPIIPEEQRLRIIKSLKCVNQAYLLDILIPVVDGFDIVAKGEGAGYENIVFPIKKVLLDYHSDNSTTRIIEKINDNFKPYHRQAECTCGNCGEIEHSVGEKHRRGKRDTGQQ